MTDIERRSWIKRIPALAYPAVAFMALGLLTQDRLAFFAGGALLVIASLQWGRTHS